MISLRFFSYLTIIIPVVFFLFGQTTFAYVHPFTTHMVVGGDVTPPTAPAPFGATAVASDQIDLVWGASTDDTAVAGYRVFRDSLQVATTTLTTFSDIGLAPETEYTYHVDAFDVFYNYSTSSDFAVATTLVEYIPPSLPPPDDSDSSGSYVQVVKIDSVVVTPQQFSAQLDWVTNVPTSYVIRWGRTDSYELGSVHGGQYLFEHSSVITDLELATRYFYEIEAIQGVRSARKVFRGEFTTSGTIPDQAVANVLDLRARVDGNSVRLEWRNPDWSDFSHVRVVRSHLFYPQNATDGMVLYDGSGQSFHDEEVFLQKPVWYYAIFVYDKSGRISSGATVMVTNVEDKEIPPDSDFDDSVEVDLFAMDVALSQGEATSYLHAPAKFSALKPLFVSIPISAVPRHLKSIIVNITHPSRGNESSSYLLKINPAGTAYETLLPPTMEAGRSRLTVTLYNYELSTVRTVSNYVEFEIESRLPPLPWWVKALIPHLLLLGFLLVTLGLVLTRWYFWRRSQTKM